MPYDSGLDPHALLGKSLQFGTLIALSMLGNRRCKEKAWEWCGQESPDPPE